MSAWPFEAIAEAKRNFDKRRIELMRALAEWTAGTADYANVEATMATLETELATFKSVVEGLRDQPGRPRDPHGRFDPEGHITAD